MTFISLLVKELRVRMRRERTMWIVIGYVLLMGFIGWFFISRSTLSLSYSGSGLSDTGLVLYTLLAQGQLLLIIFITPGLTATTMNGEKEQLTYDMLLCSRLSSFALVAAKLAAGLLNALLLIAAAVPLFSLVFFFGGISFLQFLRGLLVFVMAALTIGSLGLLCSTLFHRPGISTSITYMASMIWIFLPLISLSILNSTSDANASALIAPSALPPWLQFSGLVTSGVGQGGVISQTQILLICNPIVALFNTYGSGMTLAPYMIRNVSLAPWLTYTIICLLASTLFFLLSMWMAKPNPWGRLPLPWRKQLTSAVTA
jgi:ABC-type transport system involved in multi-copper enzyme maturation permease subunit